MKRSEQQKTKLVTVEANAQDRWRIAELGEVCQVQLGKMLSPKSKTGVRPIPYLRNENVQWNRFELSDVSWMDFSDVEEEKFRLIAGDLLVCEGGEPGRAAVWDGQIERCCYQKALHRIRPHGDLIYPPFLMFRLWMSAFTGEFVGSQTKTTISHLPREKLVQLKIPVPPIEEQKRIAGELMAAMAAVDAARRASQEQLATINALPAALLRQVFGASE